MQDASCGPEELLAAFSELIDRLDQRRNSLWSAYHSATSSMSKKEYDTEEPECWGILHAGLAGVDAEQRVLRREVESRLTAMGGHSEELAV